MKKLTEERAAELRAQGITHVASIVKSHYHTQYYKWERIEVILSHGGKMPPYAKYNGFVHGRRKREIDWGCTIRWSQI